jgi:hypothetical protein
VIWTSTVLSILSVSDSQVKIWALQQKSETPARKGNGSKNNYFAKELELRNLVLKWCFS